MIEKIRNLRHYRHGKNFAKFLIMGIVWALLFIFLMWLFIDIFGFSGLIGSSIVVTIGLFGKFYSYILIRLIKADFIKFASTTILSCISNILLMWLFVDILKIKTIISSVVVVCGLFILRFIAFNKIGLIRG